MNTSAVRGKPAVDAGIAPVSATSRTTATGAPFGRVSTSDATQARRLLRAVGIAGGSALIALLGTSAASAQVTDSVRPVVRVAWYAEVPPWAVQPQSSRDAERARGTGLDPAQRVGIVPAGVVINE